MKLNVRFSSATAKFALLGSLGLTLLNAASPISLLSMQTFGRGQSAAAKSLSKEIATKIAPIETKADKLFSR